MKMSINFKDVCVDGRLIDSCRKRNGVTTGFLKELLKYARLSIYLYIWVISVIAVIGMKYA